MAQNGFRSDRKRSEKSVSETSVYRARSLAMAVACAAGLTLAAPVASAQVLGGAPYAPAPDPVMERLQAKVETLETSLRDVTGRSEQFAYELSQARAAAQQAKAENDALKATIASLTARIDALERFSRGEAPALGPALDNATLTPAPGGGPLDPAAVAPASDAAALESGAPVALDTAALPEDETELMTQARGMFLNGDFGASRQAFATFLDRYPKSDKADDAQYMLAESLLYQDNYADAATEYGKLLNAYPKSDRGPEALVKLARSMRLMGKKSEACKALGLMPSRFPKASATAKTLASAEKSRAGC
ncbi:MAG: tol-pal system protein YbgF [Hyphomonadaceae bacterium]